jgi:hypothetical protein
LDLEAVDYFVKRAPFLSPLVKAVFLSVFNVIAAAVIYRFLYKTGWVTHHYDLRDPDSINLVPVIVEPFAVLCVLAYWVWRTPFLYRLLFVLAMIQVLFGAAFAAFVLFFALTYHPRMM